jgi:hypothetical protein
MAGASAMLIPGVLFRVSLQVLLLKYTCRLEPPEARAMQWPRVVFYFRKLFSWPAPINERFLCDPDRAASSYGSFFPIVSVNTNFTLLTCEIRKLKNLRCVSLSVQRLS